MSTPFTNKFLIICSVSVSWLEAKLNCNYLGTSFHSQIPSLLSLFAWWSLIKFASAEEVIVAFVSISTSWHFQFFHGRLIVEFFEVFLKFNFGTSRFNFTTFQVVIVIPNISSLMTCQSNAVGNSTYNRRWLTVNVAIITISIFFHFIRWLFKNQFENVQLSDKRNRKLSSRHISLTNSSSLPST